MDTVKQTSSFIQYFMSVIRVCAVFFIFKVDIFIEILTLSWSLSQKFIGENPHLTIVRVLHGLWWLQNPNNWTLQ